jgi:hypothetical protein
MDDRLHKLHAAFRSNYRIKEHPARSKSHAAIVSIIWKHASNTETVGGTTLKPIPVHNTHAYPQENDEYSCGKDYVWRDRIFLINPGLFP